MTVTVRDSWLGFTRTFTLKFSKMTDEGTEGTL